MTDQNYDPIAQTRDDLVNRGKDNKFDDASFAPIRVTLMSIDETIINYITTVIKPTIIDNDRSVPVPVIYATPERWKTIRKDGVVRDNQMDKALTPIIVLRRTNLKRNDMTNPSNKYVYRTFHNPWNRRNAYDKFAVLNGITPSQELTQVIVPDYITINYEVILWTDFQEQMNSLIEQINVENEEWWGQRNQFKFRVRIDDYSSTSDLPAETDRLVRNTFNMTVQAYLLPERMVKNFQLNSTNFKQYTAKKLVTFVEVESTHIPKDPYVRFREENGVIVPDYIPQDTD